MKRYIDADLVQQIADAELGNRDKGTVQWVIAHTPTADVQEVRHGKWIEDKETGSLTCSECGHFTDEIIGDMIEADEDISLALEIPQKTIIHRSMNPIYCSKCGAKMDGEREEEVENA